MKNLKVRQSRAVVCVLVCLLLLSCAGFGQTPGKRPITHRDYANWRNIQNQKLSPDGKLAAYAIFPQEGDGEVVIRNLATGLEIREPAGAKPAPPPANPLNEITGEGERPPDRSITIAFTSDSHFVVFSTFPPKADVDKAKRDKKKPEEMPKDGLVIYDLTKGTPARVARVKSFQVPEKNSTWIAYLKEREVERPEKKEVKPEGDAKAEAKSDAKPADEKKDDKKKKEFGGELVLRNLVTGEERTVADVMEYSITKDGSTLVYAVASKKEDTNGVYAIATATAAAPQTLANGPGKYAKLTWDEKQTQLAFVTDRDDQKSKPTKFKVYRWDTKTPAVAIAALGDAGLNKDYTPAEKASLSFTRDGKHLFFGVVQYESEKSKDDLLDDDKVSGDLWSWKDDNVQPMQKARAEADRNRTFRAVYHIELKKTVQLADTSMTDVTPNEDGSWAIGTDNREYRPMIEYGVRVNDSYLVNTITGERKVLAKKHEGRFQWSPDGKYVINYNGKDWTSTAIPVLTTVNLTEKLGVSFADEEDDHPDVPEAYGIAGWTKDSKYVLINDRYDVWQIAPDGKSAKNLTAGLGRKEKITFRYVRINPDSKDPDDRWIDPAKPFLLRAVNEDTRDSGFFRTRIDSAQPPQKLIMEARAFTNPVKAKDADVLMLAASRFDEFPDLRTSDMDFRELKKFTDANPQKAQLLWGTAELISFRNADGVPLKAALYKPANFDPKKKYPMMVYIYEKLSDGVNNFVDPRPSQNINFSYYTSNGYIVITPDIVYDIGYPGKSALKCVLPAIDAVIDMGFVDEKAIGIQGHSWGGYQISYLVTQTNRFAAAAAGAPVSNMTSAYNGIRWGSGLPRQFQYEHTQSRIGGTLWQYPMRFMENSPIFSADRVKTPLMILHNDADDMVPWYQGVEYFLALRRLGKEAYMFSYNGEPHGIRRRANQKDYTVRMQQFFDHYLKGAPAPAWMEKGIPYLRKDDEKINFIADAYGTTNTEKPVEAAKPAEKAVGNMH